MTIKEISSVIIRGESVLKFPLKYSNDTIQIISDANGGRVADLRGWGRLSYHPDGLKAAAKLQDAIGEWIVATLNDEARRNGLLCSYDNCLEAPKNKDIGFCQFHNDNLPF